MNLHKSEFNKAFSMARVTYRAWKELWEMCDDCQTQPDLLAHALEEIERKFEEVQPHYVRARACVNSREKQKATSKRRVIYMKSVIRSSQDEIPF